MTINFTYTQDTDLNNLPNNAYKYLYIGNKKDLVDIGKINDTDSKTNRAKFLDALPNIKKKMSEEHGENGYYNWLKQAFKNARAVMREQAGTRPGVEKQLSIAIAGRAKKVQPKPTSQRIYKTDRNSIKIEPGRGQPVDKNKRKIPYDLCDVDKYFYPGLEHQKSAINAFLKSDRHGMVLWHSTGSGKTVTAIYIAMCFLQRHPVNGMVVIMTPVGLRDNIKNTFKMMNISIDSGHFKFTTPDEFINADFNCSGDTLLIIDEAHNLRTTITPKPHVDIDFKKYKNRNVSQLQREAKVGGNYGITEVNEGKKAYTIINEASSLASKVVVMTATPFINSPSDIVNLIVMANGWSAEVGYNSVNPKVTQRC